ncbi:hypothetical protein ACP70R_003044 [Stipagrostis hirtigluma subsp. patula]
MILNGEIALISVCFLPSPVVAANKATGSTPVDDLGITDHSKDDLDQQEPYMTPDASGVFAAADGSVDLDESYTITSMWRRMPVMFQANQGWSLAAIFLSRKLVFFFSATVHHPLVIDDTAGSEEIGASKARQRLFIDSPPGEEADPVHQKAVDDCA